MAAPEGFRILSLAEARHDIAVPAVDVARSLTQVFETPHAAASLGDESVRAVEVAMATSAAPADFPAVRMLSLGTATSGCQPSGGADGDDGAVGSLGDGRLLLTLTSRRSNPCWVRGSWKKRPEFALAHCMSARADHHRCTEPAQGAPARGRGLPCVRP